MKAPMIHLTDVSGDEPGYYVGTALDELALWAVENGCPAEQFLERAQEAVERAEGFEL